MLFRSTFRLSVFARRREIEIMKYVGATNRMVTLPFFVEGLTMCLISGILTAAVSFGCYTYVVNAARDGLHLHAHALHLGQRGAVRFQAGRAQHLPRLYAGLFLPVG